MNAMNKIVLLILYNVHERFNPNAIITEHAHGRVTNPNKEETLR